MQRGLFFPDFGRVPSIFLGREDVLDTIHEIFDDMRTLARGGGAIIVTGSRGMGKTSLVLEILDKALHNHQFITINSEAVKRKSFATILYSALNNTFQQLGMKDGKKKDTTELFFSVTSLPGISASYKRITPGEKDNTADIHAILDNLISQAYELNTCAVVAIDEVQNLTASEFGEIASYAQRSNKEDLPIMFILSGLPGMHDKIRQNASYLERALTFDLPLLSRKVSQEFLIQTFSAGGEILTSELANSLAQLANGYPFALQVYGDRAWRHRIISNPEEKLDMITSSAKQRLEPLFAERWRSASNREKEILIVLAQHSIGELSAAEIAHHLDVPITTITSYIQRLHRKGTIIKTSIGKNTVFVPAFSDYILTQIM